MAMTIEPCGDCGMPCEPGEYHPFAACLMFKACHQSDVVRANLQFVVDHGKGAHLSQPAQAVDVGVRPICQNSAESAGVLTNTSKTQALESEAVAWQLRIGDSPDWSFCSEEWQADFYGKQSGLRYEKRPLYPRALSAEKAGWRDMDSAPKDGTRVLVAYSIDGAIEIDGAMWCEPDGLWMLSDGFLCAGESEPTHWQPLPASPTPDKEGCDER
jgi:hypothetical protein